MLLAAACQRRNDDTVCRISCGLSALPTDDYLTLSLLNARMSPKGSRRGATFLYRRETRSFAMTEGGNGVDGVLGSMATRTGIT